MEILQNFIFPEDSAFGSLEKYLRASDDVKIQESKMQMTNASSAVFDTYYNAFSIPLWREKVGISQFSLQIAGKGLVCVEVCQFTENGEKILKTINLSLTETGKALLEFDTADFEGLVYPKITAQSKVSISAMSWVTADKTRRTVKLGISITTFNRKAYVLPAIARIKAQLLSLPFWQDKINLVVVDNSSNLTKEEAAGVKVIPNENTGGSGGFMRGFLHYKNETDATHVLFMDDDAALEIESIKRAYQILSFTQQDNTAVGAALFYDDRPDLFVERGASLGKYWVKVEFQKEDSTDVNVVLKTERNWEKKTPDSAFAGWWFNAFPIKSVKHLVPPFFVRSDDMAFAQFNDFNLIWANGIASYAEDFQKKMTALTTYLDARNMLLYYALFSKNILSISYYIAMNGLISLLAARYEHHQLERLALNDFLKMTPEKWVKAASLAEKLPEINNILKNERLKPIDIDSPTFVSPEDKKESTLKSLLKMIFLPRKNRTVKSEFLMLPHFSQLAGSKRILYYLGDKGFIVTVRPWKLFSGLFMLAIDSLRLIFGFGRVRRRLLAKFDYLTSEEMWQEIFGGDWHDKS
ncbi:glycosyltransferase family 2 protein [Lactovum odontotermitis]